MNRTELIRRRMCLCGELRIDSWAFLSMIKNPIVRAVLDLHAMVDAAHEYAEPTCAHCVYDSEMGDHEDWPCETTRVIAIAYGIEMPR